MRQNTLTAGVAMGGLFVTGCFVLGYELDKQPPHEGTTQSGAGAQGAAGAGAAGSAGSGGAGGSPECGGDETWVGRVGDRNFEEVHGVSTDDCGAVIVGGIGGWRALVAKLNEETGDVAWERRVGDGTNVFDYQIVQGVAADPAGDVVAVGSFRSNLNFGDVSHTADGADGFVAKLRATDGQAIYSRILRGASAQSANAVAVDASGNIYVAGDFAGLVLVDDAPPADPVELDGAAGTEIVVAKYDSAGKLAWAKSFGAAGEQTAMTIAVDSTGAVLIGGVYQGGFTLGSDATMPNAGTKTIGFLAKLNASGTPLWSRGFGDLADTEAAPSRVNGVAVDSSDSVVLVGYARGSIVMPGGASANVPLTAVGGRDVVVAKYGKAGDLAWATMYGVMSDEEGRGVAVGEGDSIRISGSYDGALSIGMTLPASDGKDGFFAKLDAGGAPVWAKGYNLFPGFSIDFPYLAAVTRDGHRSIFACSSQGPVDFGTGLIPASGDRDIYVAKLSADGTIP